MKTKLILCCLASLVGPIRAFTVDPSRRAVATAPHTRHAASASAAHRRRRRSTPALPVTRLDAAVPDLDVVGLVAGQENYGLAIVALGEAVWSFAQAPSLSHAKVLVPASTAAVVLFAVSGPMITGGGDAGTVALGLEIATGVSILLGARRVLPSLFIICETMRRSTMMKNTASPARFFPASSVVLRPPLFLSNSTHLPFFVNRHTPPPHARKKNLTTSRGVDNRHRPPNKTTSYVARLLAPYSPSAKEAAFAGLLIAVAGFFSFSQNLVVDGFGECTEMASFFGK